MLALAVTGGGSGSSGADAMCRRVRRPFSRRCSSCHWRKCGTAQSACCACASCSRPRSADPADVRWRRERSCGELQQPCVGLSSGCSGLTRSACFAAPSACIACQDRLHFTFRHVWVHVQCPCSLTLSACEQQRQQQLRVEAFLLCVPLRLMKESHRSPFLATVLCAGRTLGHARRQDWGRNQERQASTRSG